MSPLLAFFLDFLFPPTQEALALRACVPEEIFKKLPPAPASPDPFITPLFAYKNPLVAELVLSIKNRKDQHCIELGAYALYTKLKELAKEPVLLIPIPISKSRRRERGYNQCEVLIDKMIELDAENQCEKSFNTLLRTKDSGEQKLKSRSERLESTASIFNAKFTPTEKPIILIDDVTTTGSTLKEAREVLLQAGYKDVSALTLSH